MTEQAYSLAEPLRGSTGKVVRLGKKKLEVLNCVWNEFKQSQDAFALAFNRTNFNRLKAAGTELVRVQTLLGVWVVHPNNARPGLAQDDERIVLDPQAITEAENAQLKAENAHLLGILEDYGITR